MKKKWYHSLIIIFISIPCLFGEVTVDNLISRETKKRKEANDLLLKMEIYERTYLIEELIPYLGDTDPGRAMWAAKALGHTSEDAIEPIKNFALDNLPASSHAVQALKFLGAQSSEELADILAHPDCPKETREFALGALNKFGKRARNATHKLHLTLDDPDENIHERVIATLANIRSDSSVPFLILKLNDASLKVRGAAAMALGRFGSRAESAVEPLIEALNNESYPVPKEIVSGALKQIDTPEAKVALDNMGIVIQPKFKTREPAYKRHKTRNSQKNRLRGKYRTRDGTGR